jgi:hypothetical protein
MLVPDGGAEAESCSNAIRHGEMIRNCMASIVRPKREITRGQSVRILARGKIAREAMGRQRR